MKKHNTAIAYNSFYICMKSEVKERMNEFFATHPYYKKSHWIGEAIEEKLAREKKKTKKQGDAS